MVSFRFIYAQKKVLPESGKTECGKPLYLSLKL